MGNHDDWVRLSRVFRPLVLNRDGHLCQIAGPRCQAPGHPLPPSELEVDHIKPLAWGGAIADMANMQAVCRECHWRKSALEAGNHAGRFRRRPQAPRPGWQWEGITAG